MRRKIKTVMEQMNAEKPDAVLADLEAKHGSQQRLVTRLEWSKATNEERNAACAAFMPPSEINPLCSYYLTKDGNLWQRLAVKNLDEAKQWLAFAKSKVTYWEKVMPEMTWTDRKLVDVAEDKYHARYSDTPGGAWMLVEELASKGWTVSVTTTDHSSGVSAIRQSAHHHVIGKMSEAVAECFLKANGVDTSDAKPCNTEIGRVADNPAPPNL